MAARGEEEGRVAVPVVVDLGEVFTRCIDDHAKRLRHHATGVHGPARARRESEQEMFDTILQNPI